MNVGRRDGRHRLALLLGESPGQGTGGVLIPVGDRGQIQRQVVVVPVLDGVAAGLFEVDGVGDVEAVEMGAPQPARFIVHPGIAKVRMLEQLLGRPRGVEIVLSAGAVQRGLGIAIDENHLVALAVPHRARTIDVVVDADEVTPALDVGEDVVAPAVAVAPGFPQQAPLVLAPGQGLGELMIVPGVKAAEILGQLRNLHVVDIEVKGVDRASALVLDLDPRPGGKGHRKVAHVRFSPAGRDGQGRADEIIGLAPAVAKERADRRLDRGIRLSVPKHPDDDIVAVQRVRPGRQGDPNVGDDAGAWHVHDVHFGPVRDVRDVVRVAAGAIVAADAPRFHLRADGREADEFTHRFLGRENGCRHQGRCDGEE